MSTGRPTTDRALGAHRRDARRVGRELAAPDGFQRRGDGERGVGQRQPDGPLAHVQAEQAPVAPERRLQRLRIDDGHGAGGTSRRAG